MVRNFKFNIEQYVNNYGIKNIYGFIFEAIRNKIFMNNKYDESFSDKEIDLIEKLLSVSIKKDKIKDLNDFMERQYKRLDEKEKFIILEKSELTEMDADEIASLVKRSIREHHDVNLSEM